MSLKVGIVLCLYLNSISSAPMKLQVIPFPYGMQAQMNPMMQLQNPFFKQTVPNLQPFVYQQQPMMFLLPNPSAEADDRFLNLKHEDSTNSLKSNTGHINEKKDAVVLDAEPIPSEMDVNKAEVLMPNGARFSIGQIISYIPFLPIEINVPDTINWIAGLFPGNWFSRPAQKPDNTQRLSNKGPMPVFVVPAPMMMNDF